MDREPYEQTTTLSVKIQTLLQTGAAKTGFSIEGVQSQKMVSFREVHFFNLLRSKAGFGVRQSKILPNSEFRTPI